MEELDTSELGTQEYWDNCYQTEIKNFSNRGDPGEIWFGEDIVDRLIRWMDKSENVKKDSSVIDVGCGNGMLLVDLANNGYSNLTGIDYSENAIKLAKSVADKYKVNIKFEFNNILEGLPGQYDIILDKGTYDAVSLSSDAKHNREMYIKHVHDALENNGLFIITSCNWTLDELKEHFDSKFILLSVIPTPQFKFGGSVGNVVTSCAFKKNIK